MRKLLPTIRSSALLLLAVLMAASFAHAQIVQLANNQGQGGCTSSGGPGGTLCFSTSPPTPYLLTDIENGTEVLTIPNTSSTPVWYVENNTGSTVPSLSLVFSGNLASNANLQCNFGGGESGTCTVDGVMNGLSNPIPPGDLPATIKFSGLSIGNGTYFEISTASFAAAGQDYGTLTGVGVPEPSTLSMVGLAGMLFVTGIVFRRIVG